MAWLEKLKGILQKSTSSVHPCRYPRDLSDYAIAEQALISRDFSEGIYHLGRRLMRDPADAETLALLDAYLASTDILQLLPGGEEAFAEDETIRAYALMKRGQWQEALEVLIELHITVPDDQFLPAWGLRWIEEAVAASAISRNTTRSIIAALLRPYAGLEQDYVDPWSTEHETLERIIAVIDATLTSNDQDALLLTLHSLALRKVGRFTDAITSAAQAVAISPDWLAILAQVYAVRYAEGMDAATTMFAESAAVHTPTADALLEIGKFYLLYGEWGNALAIFERFLDDAPYDNWFRPTVWFCRFQQTNDKEWLEKLQLFACNSSHAQELLSRLELLQGCPLPALDATADFLRQIVYGRRQSSIAAGDITLTVSTLEAPSVYIALDLLLERMGNQGQVSVLVSQIPTPDPREPVGAVEHLLWRYDGIIAMKNLSPPAQPVVDYLARIATAPYDLHADWQRAGTLAGILGTQAVDDVLAVMIYPPPLPAWAEPTYWVRRIQTLAAMTLAQLDSGLYNSLRWRVLSDLLLGPTDWCVDAAAIALLMLGKQIPHYAKPILDVYLSRLNTVPVEGYCCYEPVILHCILHLPEIAGDIRKMARRRLETLAQATADA